MDSDFREAFFALLACVAGKPSFTVTVTTHRIVGESVGDAVVGAAVG